MVVTRLSGGTPEDQAKTFATLLSAFRADPVERWLYPDEHDYDEFFPAFLAAFGGEAFAHDTVWQLDDFAAVALWLAPGAEPDADEIVRVRMTTVDEARHGTPWRRSSRWTRRIRAIRTGICRGSGSMRGGKAPVSAGR